MAHHYQRDRFDDVPRDLARVGAHRAPVPRGRGWVVFAWAALATAVLVAAGIFWLSRIDAQYAADATDGTSPSVSATVDPHARIQVLNGTNTSGLAASVQTRLDKDGWNVTSTGNAKSGAKTTVVYYPTSGLAGAAAGVAKALGGVATQQSSQFSSSELTVVLGTDYST